MNFSFTGFMIYGGERLAKMEKSPGSIFNNTNDCRWTRGKPNRIQNGSGLGMRVLNKNKEVSTVTTVF